jgi:molybdopterin-containing oxidoreductase family molybdopterin binding subunit
MSEEKWVCTACPGWGDHEFCAIKTVVKDGKIVRTEAVDYQGAEAGEGHCCQKGIMSWRQVYAPDRLLHPLKRAGERGEGKWEQISWDQAFDEIGAKLMEIKENYGPEAVTFWNITTSLPPSQGLDSLLGERLNCLWGGTDPLNAYGLDNGPYYASYFDLGNFYKYMMIDPVKFDATTYLIVWGGNPVENQMRCAKHIVEAKSRGAKIVDVGLLFDATAGYADWFIPVKPGSDTALALCMANQIIQRGEADMPYMIKYTVAPLLVDVETGKFAANDGWFYYWDTESDAIKPTARGAEEYEGTPATEGVFEYGGHTYKPAFQLLKEHLATYTPEYQEAITGVPAADAVKLAEEYSSHRPAFIVGALGLRYQNQGDAYRALYLLGMLTGNLGQLNGGVTSEIQPCGFPMGFNNTEIVFPEGKENDRAHYVKQADYFEDVKRGKYKAFLNLAGNPVHNCPNRSRWIDDTFPQMELIVDIDVWMTDTGEYSDYVLPACMPFEREELIAAAQYNHIVLQEPAVEPQGECKDPAFIYHGLAERLGLGEYFDKTADDWIRIRLNTPYPFIANVEPKITLERLKEEKIIRAAVPPVPWDPFLGMKFETPTGHMEFYSERLQSIGLPMAAYHEPYEAPTAKRLAEGTAKHPYQFFSGRQRFFMQSMFSDDPVMAELSGGKPTGRINPVDARREGIVDGDRCEVYNERGHVVIEMRLDQAIPPGTVQVWFGWRKRAFNEGGMYSELLVPLGDADTIDDAANYWYQCVADEGKVGALLSGFAVSGMAGAWDTIWDCACEVRKLSDGEHENDENADAEDNERHADAKEA